MEHPLQCRCGTLKGVVSNPRQVSRGVCHCTDCQAYAHFLGKPGEILDAMGGTDVCATLPAYVTFTQGKEVLACMSLTDKGMLRWYARCCDTAIGNTSRDFKFSFVGLVHTCLDNDPAKSLDSSFGPVRMRTGTKSAKGKPESMVLSSIASVLRFLASVARARVGGAYKRTPFFDAQGTPIVAPKVLTAAEHERVMNAV